MANDSRKRADPPFRSRPSSKEKFDYDDEDIAALELPLPLALPHFEDGKLRKGWEVTEDWQLLAYAAGLLKHLRSIRGRKDGGIPKEDVKFQTSWLLDEFARRQLPIPTELAALVRELLNPKKVESTRTVPVMKANTAAYLTAILYEAAHAGATLHAITKHVRETVGFPRQSQDQLEPQKTGEATIKGWQKLPHYKWAVAQARTRSSRE